MKARNDYRLIEDYVRTSKRGKVIFEPGDIVQIVQFRKRLGYAIVKRTLGDKETLVKIPANVLRPQFPNPLPRRSRITHSPITNS